MSCLACGSGKRRLVYTLADKGNARIVRCEACTLMQLERIPSPEDIERLYAEGYFEEAGSEVGYESYAEQEREYLATFGEDVRRIAELAEGRRVLDVGCGYGYFLRRALAAGFDVHGVDLSEEAILEASRHTPGRVYCGELGEIEALSGRRFDVIFASHLIEHIAEPRPFVRDLAVRLEEGGILVLVTPNIESWLARISGPRWVSFKIPEHVAYYAPRTLTDVVESAGLQVLAVEPAYQYYRLPFLMSKIRELVRPLDNFVPEFERWRPLRERMLRVPSGSLRMIARKYSARG